MLLGCIGDDFTGSGDLANTLAKQGMQTVLYSGIPIQNSGSHVEAGVVALKSRSNAPTEAVEQSLQALRWLQSQGCRQFFFKYCSTFDSTEKGNIGPVAEALASALGARQVIVCPAFPGTGRSVYQGHLFVNDQLLSNSGMQNHPITPMQNSDLRQVMQAQSTSRVGHIAYADVVKGPDCISDQLTSLDNEGCLFAVVDAICDDDLLSIGAAAKHLSLVTGGSGVAMGLPANFMASGAISGSESSWYGQRGQAVVLSGSCSIATREQVTLHAKNHPAKQLMVDDVISGTVLVADIVSWVMQQENDIPVVYSSVDPEEVANIQSKHAQAVSSAALESFFAELARQLVQAGISKLIITGGETSGAVVEGLDLNDLEIGPEIDAGVPALRAGPDLCLVLKSGNFGSPTFIQKAASLLDAD